MPNGENIRRRRAGGGLLRRLNHVIELVDADRRVALAILISIDLAISVWLVLAIPAFSTYLSYGDVLVITSGQGTPSLWIGALTTYPLFVSGLAALVPYPLAQNFILIGTTMAPSLALFYFLSFWTRRNLSIITVSALFGTFLNPIFSTFFVGGSSSFGLYVTLTLVSLGVLSSVPRSVHRELRSAIAGAVFGLGLTNQLWFSFTDVTGALIAGPVVLAALAWVVLDTALGLKNRLRLSFAFVGSLAMVYGPAIYLRLLLYHAIVTSPAGSLPGASTSSSTAAFTFRNFNPLAALLNQPVNPLSSTWVPLVLFGWAVVVVLCIVGGFTAIQSQSQLRRRFAATFLVAYPSLTAIMIGIWSGLLLSLFNFATPFSTLDAPAFFLYGQSMVLPFLLLCFLDETVDWIVTSCVSTFHEVMAGVTRLIGRKTEASPGREGKESTPEWSESELAPIPPDGSTSISPSQSRWEKRFDSVGSNRELTPTQTLATCAVVILIGAGFSLPVALAIPSNLSTSPWLQGNSPFGFSDYSSVNSWYERAVAPNNSYVLVLPNTSPEYSKLQAAIPADRIWFTPYLGSQQLPDLNPALYTSTMELLAANETGPFAAALGVAGVSFVLLTTADETVDLIPTGATSGMAPTQPALVEMLESSPYFQLSERFDSFLVFANLEFHGVSNGVGPGAAFYGVGGTPLLSSRNLPFGTNFTNWTGYLNSSAVRLPNGSVSLLTNSSRSVGYVILFQTIPLSILSGNASNASGSVVLDPSTFNVTYELSLHLNVPSGAGLQIVIYWYHNSTPGSLYSQFQTTSLSPYGQVGGLNGITEQFYANFTRPVGAQSARLLFYAFPVGNSSATSTILGYPRVQEKVLAEDYSQDAPIQVATWRLMVDAGLVPPSTPLLVYPLVQSPAGPYGLAMDSILLEPGSAVNPYSQPEFDVSVTNVTNVLSPAEADQYENVSLLLTFDVTERATVTIRVAHGNVSENMTFASGQWAGLFPLGSPVSTRAASVEILGGLSLSSVGLVLTPSATAVSSSVTLPLGDLQIVWNGTSTHVLLVPPPSSPVPYPEPAGTLTNVINVLPILTIACLAGWTLSVVLWPLIPRRALRLHGDSG